MYFSLLDRRKNQLDSHQLMPHVKYTKKHQSIHMLQGSINCWALSWFLKPIYTTLTADFADSAIDRGRLSFGQSPSLPRVHVRDDRVE